MSPRRKQPDPWPWPADTPTERARRIARTYRDAYAAVAPEACRELDGRVQGLGQGWIVPAVAQFSDDDLLTVEELADFCRVQPGTIDQWCSRGLASVDTPDGRRFLIRDALEYQARARRRRAGLGESG
ncbi:hypothetical protein SAMN05421837_107345 [Amycolatopsis pretoriensis]|uniref:Helix-turn-helix domain-containing protein n=1 Tax=Amycolatopsis pretoriensis TaxID=218821 RepID=A0A1H5R8H9_9PSEU|nr:hypothetical protein [Amycolatopsis pretoriensis]SEF34374.1 hypothetical protein SAMN05421837_107345 [Amycolatopsis pretoriensis]